MLRARPRAARAIDFPIGRYPRLRDVRSDREYKERCRADGTITTYINLGFKTWPETKEAIEYIQAKGREVGFELDRVSRSPTVAWACRLISGRRLSKRPA